MNELTPKQQRKALNTKKGQLSRQIGERKKNGQAFDDILKEIQVTSAVLKALDQQIKEQQQSGAGTKSQPETHSTPPLFPQHICKPDFLSDKDNELHHIAEVNCHDKSTWNQFADQHPHSHVYHRFEFKSVIEKSFGHKCYYFAAYNKAGEIIGVLPCVHTQSRIFGNYLTSIPFFNYGGPLANTDKISEALIKAASQKSAQQGAQHLEIRESQNRQGYPSRTEKVSMFRALPEDSEQLWQDIGTKLRAQIKKGQQNQLSIAFGQAELLDDFYKVFSINMRDLGTPVYSRSFFDELLQQDGLNTTLVVQYHANKPVSCAFLLGYKNVLEIPWASTISDANKLNANMVMYWQILAFACKHQYHFFDFGRSTEGANTYKFKKQWGAKPAKLFWHYWLKEGEQPPKLNPDNAKYRLVIAVWKKLPIWLTQCAGPALVKNLP